MSFVTAVAKPQPSDVEVSQPPSDSITALAFSPTADLLAVASWDENVRLYEVSSNGQTQGRAIYSHGPTLDICWNSDGTKIFSAGADKTAKAYDVQTGQANQVAAHDEAVKCVRWMETSQMGGVLITGSWDKTIKYWDLRSPQPIGVVNLPERCYALDVKYPLMVVGTAGLQMVIINLQNPTTIFKQTVSPLKWQTRTIACFPDAKGYCIGSIEGRVACQFVDDKDAATGNFSFRCHRQDDTRKKETTIYAVNSLAYHPIYGTCITAGSDGGMFIWDMENRRRNKSFDVAPGPITATTFNRTGQILAYAVSYDWHKGYTGMTNGHPNKIMLHAAREEDLIKKKK